MHVHHFGESYERGKGGERSATDLLRSIWPEHNIREAKSMAEQRAGYDYVLTRGKEFLLVEVKTDFHTTPNLAIEMRHRYDDGQLKVGWFYGSKADWVVYQRPNLGHYLLIPLPYLRYRMQDLSRFREVAVRNTSWTTYVRLVPEVVLEDWGINRVGLPGD